MADTAQTASDPASRQRRMAVLARASYDDLVSLWRALDLDPECQVIRGPETGLVMLQGRMGGGGDAFNLGEATVTRASVRISGDQIGHAYMLGRDHKKARLAAVIDALAQDPAMAARLDDAVVAPLEARLAASDEKHRAETEATRVNFFTMVRGED